MATAKKVESSYRVLLEMDKEEAEVLRELQYKFVGGHPSGPRGVVDRIQRALADAGVELKDDLDRDGGTLFLRTKNR